MNDESGSNNNVLLRVSAVLSAFRFLCIPAKIVSALLARHESSPEFTLTLLTTLALHFFNWRLRHSADSESTAANAIRSDGLVEICVQRLCDNDAVFFDTLLAKPLGDGIYEIGEIPPQLNYGDIVRAVAHEPRPIVVEVVQRSGHRTIHVYFNFYDRSISEDEQATMLCRLNRYGARIAQPDRYGNYAIDVEPEADFESIRDQLQYWDDAGYLTFDGRKPKKYEEIDESELTVD